MNPPPGGGPADANELMRRRREKLLAWGARGVSPFGGRFPVSHTAGDLQARFKAATEDDLKRAGSVALAGRVMALRDHGKSCFADLRDSSGQIQLYARADALGPRYALFSDLDVGDVIGVTGELFRTRKGELSVAVKPFELLAKSLRPLPEKWHGLPRRGDAVSPALRRPRRQPGRAPGVRRCAAASSPPCAASSTRAAFSRSRRR